MDWVDIGANLTHEAFQPDLDEVIARARASGVTRIVVTSCDVDSSEAALALCRKHGRTLRLTVGIHPHASGNANRESLDKIQKLAEQDTVVAIGETGLDFHRDFAPRPTQTTFFEQQLEIAANTGLPIFLHERAAHRRFFEMVKDFRARLPRAVVHCFTGDKRQLFRYLDLDLHIGLTGWICDERRGAHLLDLIGEVPQNRLMWETDAPYLKPRQTLRPLKLARSGRNEPCALPHIVEFAALHAGCKSADLAAQSTRVAEDFFALPDLPEPGQATDASPADSSG